MFPSAPNSETPMMPNDPSDVAAPAYDSLQTRPTYTFTTSFAKHTSTLRLSVLGERTAMISSQNQTLQGAVPLFFTGSVIRGTASLTGLVKVLSTARELSVRIRGRLRPAIANTAYTKDQSTTSVIPDITFIEQSTTLWNASKSTPAQSQLEGRSFPFALTLPSRVRFGSVEYALPPSFSNKGARIEYSLELVLKRSGLMASDVMSGISFDLAASAGVGVDETLSSGIDSVATAFRYVSLPTASSEPGRVTSTASAAAGVPSGLFPGSEDGFGRASLSRSSSLASAASASTSNDGNTVSTFRLHDVMFKTKLLAPSPSYTRGSTVTLLLSSPSLASSPLSSILSSPRAWTLELIRCTLLGGTAARGELNHYVANGSTVLVEAVAQGVFEEVEEGAGWTMKGRVRIPADTMMGFHFGLVAVYYALRVSPVPKYFRQRPLEAHHIPITLKRDATLSELASDLENVNVNEGNVNEAGELPTYEDVAEGSGSGSV